MAQPTQITITFLRWQFMAGFFYRVRPLSAPLCVFVYMCVRFFHLLFHSRCSVQFTECGKFLCNHATAENFIALCGELSINNIQPSSFSSFQPRFNLLVPKSFIYTSPTMQMIVSDAIHLFTD